MLYKKPKILVWCDSPTVPTGFGVVAKNLLRDLHNKYEVEILGINYHGDTKYDTDKWFIYPAQSNYSNYLGTQKLDKILSKTKYDIIFMFQDIFNINEAWGIVKDKAPDSKVVLYFPIDGTPVSIAWLKPLIEADVVITYTEFAKDALLDTFPQLKLKQIHTLNHGVDSEVYKLLTEKEITSIRKENNWLNKFVILNLNRFQPRTQINLTLRACVLFAKGYHKCKCGNWYLKGRSKCDLNGCGPEDILETVPGKQDTLLYLHMMPQEPAMGGGHAHSLQTMAYNAGYRNIDLKGPKQSLQINSVNLYVNPFSEETLNKIYNASCVNISTAIGEGFGFSLAESAMTGTISIAPKNSAIPEVLGNTGHIIPNIAHFSMVHDHNHVRPIVDVRKMIEALEIEYKAWVENGRKPVKRKNIIDFATKNFNWDEKRDFLEKIFETVLSEETLTTGGSFVLANNEEASL